MVIMTWRRAGMHAAFCAISHASNTSNNGTRTQLPPVNLNHKGRSCWADKPEPKTLDGWTTRTIQPTGSNGLQGDGRFDLPHHPTDFHWSKDSCHRGAHHCKYDLLLMDHHFHDLSHMSSLLTEKWRPRSVQSALSAKLLRSSLSSKSHFVSLFFFN